MTYARRPKAKRSYKKRNNARRPTLDQKIRTIAKSVVLRTSETKMNVRKYDTINVLHNQHGGQRLGFHNLLLTTQGVGDGTNDINNSFNRVGDEILPKGINLYLSILNNWQNPAAKYRLIVAKTRGNVVSSVVHLLDITDNATLDPIYPEQPLSIVYDRMIVPRLATTGRHDSTEGHNSDTTTTRKVWIPLSGKYRYSQDNGLEGLRYNLVAYILAYNHADTADTNILGRCTIATQFFFKDM